MFKKLLPVLMVLSGPAIAADYQVIQKDSTISFGGTHADTPFNGKFTDWNAEISFDAADLENSHIKATMKSESADTGNKMYDGTLPQQDWLNVKEFPDILFSSKSIHKNKEDTYTATGDLTLRGITKPIDLIFTVSDLTKDEVTAKGHLTINRFDFAIGKKSDKDAEWVGREIKIEIDLKAIKK